MSLDLKEAEEKGLRELQYELSYSKAKSEQSFYYAEYAMNTACTPKQWMDAVVLRAKLGWHQCKNTDLSDLRLMATKGGLTADAYAILGYDALTKGDNENAFQFLSSAHSACAKADSPPECFFQPDELCWWLAALSVVLEKPCPALESYTANAWLDLWNQCEFSAAIDHPNLPDELCEEVYEAALRDYLKPVRRVAWSQMAQELSIEGPPMLPDWAELRDGIVYVKHL